MMVSCFVFVNKQYRLNILAFLHWQCCLYFTCSIWCRFI